MEKRKPTNYAEQTLGKEKRRKKQCAIPAKNLSQN